MRTQHFFTFGAEHRLPTGESANGKFVTVTAVERHREIFMGWLGSNAFSTEYDRDEWVGRRMDRYYSQDAHAAAIQVFEAPAIKVYEQEAS